MPWLFLFEQAERHVGFGQMGQIGLLGQLGQLRQLGRL